MTQRGRQIDRNLASRPAWEQFSPHRAQVMARILNAAEKLDLPTLCVLGAGNCNDLDIRGCLEKCGSVTLLDFDLKAMKAATERQQVESDPRLRLTEVDLADADSNNLVAETWDIVVSTCLLSQLIESTTSTTSATSANTQTASQMAVEVSDQHLRLMTRMLADGGTGILVSDFVSSDSLPELLHVSDDQIPSVAQRCLVNGNFFSGTNPFPIRSKLESEFAFRAKIATPWRWWLGKRAFLVYALEFTFKDS